MKDSRDRGSIYITVIIIIAVLLMLLSMLVIIASRDIRTSNLYSEGIRAYYIAQTGISRGIDHIKDFPETDKIPEQTDTNIFLANYPAFHSVTWSVVYNSTDENYTIIAKGLYRLSDKLTVKRNIEVVVRSREGFVEIDSWKQFYD